MPRPSAAFALALLAVVLEAAVPCSQPIVVHHDTPYTGLLHSPNWPDPYPNRVSCIYNLSTAVSNVIHLVFSHFDIAPRSQRSLQCLDAYVLIVVVDRQGKQHIGDRMCGGDTFDRVFESMQSTLILEFVSFSNTVRTGFKIEYQIISEASIRQPPSFYFDNDRTLEASCGGRNPTGSHSGEITSPGFPLAYPRNISCSWLIRVEPTQRIYVKVVNLNITDIKECSIGEMSISDGYRHETRGQFAREERGPVPNKAKFCGNLKFYEEEGQRSYLSTSNRLVIRFRTGARKPLVGSDEHKVGVKLLWTAINGIVDEEVVFGDVPAEQAAKSCSQFTCHGGLLCLDQGQGICAAKSQFCIDSSLVCDGVPNCAEGDFSDEFHCHSTEIFLSGGAAVLALLFIILAALCCERARRSRALKKALDSERRAPSSASSKNGRPVWEDRSQRRPQR